MHQPKIKALRGIEPQLAGYESAVLPIKLQHHLHKVERDKNGEHIGDRTQNHGLKVRRFAN